MRQSSTWRDNLENVREWSSISVVLARADHDQSRRWSSAGFAALGLASFRLVRVFRVLALFLRGSRWWCSQRVVSRQSVVELSVAAEREPHRKNRTACPARPVSRDWDVRQARQAGEKRAGWVQSREMLRNSTIRNRGVRELELLTPLFGRFGSRQVRQVRSS